MLKAEILEKLKPITEEEHKIINGQTDIDRSLYMDSPFNIINSKKMMDMGNQITIRPHTRFVHFPEHSHDYIEIIRFMESDLIQTSGGTLDFDGDGGNTGAPDDGWV